MIGDGEEDRWQDCDQAGENAVVRISDIFSFQASVVYYVLSFCQMLWELQKLASCSFYSHGTYSLLGPDLYDEVVQTCLWLTVLGRRPSKPLKNTGCEVHVPDGHQCKCSRLRKKARNGLKGNENAAHPQGV